ncbi:MAG: lysozyme inhibitor LprI family protein [Bacteroidota bacterium]
MKHVLIAFTIVLISQHGFAQTNRAGLRRYVNSAEKNCQACVDAGTNNFITCEKTFYRQMDSVLNVAYRALKHKLTPLYFENLKADQKNWLAKRDRYFLEQQHIEESGAGPEADQALAIHNEALFVKDRVLYLLAKL